VDGIAPGEALVESRSRQVAPTGWWIGSCADGVVLEEAACADGVVTTVAAAGRRQLQSCGVDQLFSGGADSCLSCGVDQLFPGGADS